MSITRTLLASDLDGTLIPLERTEKRLREVRELSSLLLELDLAYVTGRHLSLAQRGVAETGLPAPSWFVCDVGTSVYHEAAGGFEVDEEYRRRMREAFGGLRGLEVRDAIGTIRGLSLQEDEKQAEFKVSYYSEGRPEPLVDQIQSRLDAAGAHVNLVVSFDPLTRRGLLDVLPAGIAKDYAIRYLHERSGMPEERVIYAGDSGNDRAAMLSGFRAIVVGNAEEALKRDLAEQAARLGLTDRIYFAKEPYAAGVHEGLRHYLGLAE
jgi:HAD superfamily hydrolase (TIGR01484 family)